MLPRDIENLAHTVLTNVKNYRVRSLRLTGSQGTTHLAVSLLEDLQSIEQREREDFSARYSEAGDARRRGESGLSVATLPGLPALQAPADSPKDIIFSAFIHDPPFRSLTLVHTDKLDKLVRSVALALRTASDPDSFLQVDEDNLLTFLVTHQHMPLLQQLLYQVLYCEQVTRTPRYEAFVQSVLAKIQDVATAGHFIKVLPRLTDDVWNYLREHSEQIEDLFEILKALIQTSEEGHKGLTMVFAIVEHATRDLQKRAIELISKQLYFICPGIIEDRAIADFKALWCRLDSDETMTSTDVEPKVRLFFKLIQKNHSLLTHLISQYTGVQNPATKKCILKHYTRAVRKGKINLEHPLLVSLVESAATDSPLLADTLGIVKDLLASTAHVADSPMSGETVSNVKDLRQSCERIKEIAVKRMRDEPVVTWKEAESMLRLILQQDSATQNIMLQSLLDSSDVDPDTLLVRVTEAECVPAVKYLVEVRRVYSSSVLQRAIEVIIDLDPLPILSMYVILKTLHEFPELKPFLLTEALPRLLERQVWQNGRIWNGVIKFVKSTLPDSISLLEFLPLEVRRDLERLEEVRKGKVEFNLRQKKHK